MRVIEVMSEGVRTVSPTLTLAAARDVMRQKGIHHLVVKDNSDVVGVLSDRDVRGRVGDARVAEAMTRNVVTVHANDTIRSVANVMRGRTIGCVPVVEGKRLVGIVTVSDLLEVLGRGVDRPVKPSRRTPSHRVPHRKAHRTGGSW